MQVVSLLMLAVLLTSVHGRQDTSPVSKVFEMLEGLQAKIIKEGEESQKTYDEFSEWCEERSKNVGFEIKTAKAEIAELSAAIGKASSTVSALTTKVEELSGSIAKDEADLKAAEKIRAEEAAAFAAEEKETNEVIGTLERAIAILDKKMKNGGASMMQLKNAGSMAQALSVLVRGSVFSSADAKRLTVLMQNSQESEDDEFDAAVGAPDASVYKSHSVGIIDTLESLLDKAQTQLSKAQKAEETSLHNYEMLKQSLEDEIKFAEQDMAAANKGKASAEEGKATAEGDLSVTTADLKEDSTTLATLHQDCLSGATDFEAETKSRGQELKTLATAKTILQQAVGGAASQTYALNQEISLLQVASRAGLSTGADLANFEAVRFVRDLARKENSAALSQLASRMLSVIRLSKASGAADPFSKVKTLLSDMVAKLESDAASDASHKAYCDKETSEATAKKDEKKALIDKISTKIGLMSAESAKLKEEVAALQKQLAEIASSQADMNKIRSDEKALYTKNKAEMEAGIEGVKKALVILKDYYAQEGKAHSAAEGTSGGIIGLLEVVESDFTRGLVEMEATESTAEIEYSKVTKENEMATTTKSQDVKYKAKEAAHLDKSVAETSSDLDGTQTELDAVMEYLEKLTKMCVAKAEPYSERKARREAEISGLKEALNILDGEAMLIQKTANKRLLRGDN